MTAPTPQAAPMVPATLLFADLVPEFAASRRLLERFPEEHFDWRPHEKSMTLGRLAQHVAELPQFGSVIASQPEWDFAVTKYEPPTARTRDELLAMFDERSAAARDAVASLDAEALGAEWRLRAGDAVFASGPRAVVFRQLLVSHTAHHRGQLTVYYRMLGVPVPGLYGPSADE